MRHLQIHLLGTFRAILDGQPIAGFESNKVRALLSYLAVEADQPHSRDELIGLLWPDQPDTMARANLRNALSNLRQAIADQSAQLPFLSITRETVQFNRASDFSLDVNRFIDLLAACRQQAVELYRGDFLAQFMQSVSEAFKERGCSYAYFA